MHNMSPRIIPLAATEKSKPRASARHFTPGGEARIARDHEQRFELRQRGDDVFHRAVGKILLLRIAAHALKGQN
jgi:hypothetical protein